MNALDLESVLNIFSDEDFDLNVYDFLLAFPQEMQLRYLFIFRGQQCLIKFYFNFCKRNCQGFRNPKSGAIKTFKQTENRAIELSFDKLFKYKNITIQFEEKDLLNYVESHLRNKNCETGGMICGYYSEKLLNATITEFCKPPKDPVLGKPVF